MKLTTKQLKRMIIKEINSIVTESALDPRIAQLLRSDDGMDIIQGIDLADALDAPVEFYDLNQKSQILQMVIKHPTVKDSEKAMRIFATAPSSNAYILGKVARNPVTPVDVLQSLMKNDRPRVRASLALNPSSTKEMLDVLSKDRGVKTKRHVAANPNATAEILDRLVDYGIKTTYYHLVEIVATHDNVSNETLLKFVQNPKVPARPRRVVSSVLKMRGYGEDELVPIKPESSEFDKMFRDPPDFLEHIIKEELTEMARRDPYGERDHGKWFVDKEYVDNLASSLGVSGEVVENTTEMKVNYTILLGVQQRRGSVDEFKVSLTKNRKRPLQKTNYAWFSVRRSILKKSLMFPLSGDINRDAEFVEALKQLSWNQLVDLSNSQTRGDYAWVNKIMPGYYRG